MEEVPEPLAEILGLAVVAVRKARPPLQSGPPSGVVDILEVATGLVEVIADGEPPALEGDQLLTGELDEFTAALPLPRTAERAATSFEQTHCMNIQAASRFFEYLERQIEEPP